MKKKNAGLLFAVMMLAALLAGCGGGGGGGGIPFILPQTPETTSGAWAWISGATTIDQTGVYGTKGASNAPGARTASVSWTDTSGNLWLFGGYGVDSTNAWGSLNDLWKFDGANWIWVSGELNRDQQGGYPADHVTCAAGALPGSRKNAVSWTDASGNLWLFGGDGYGKTGTGWLNDLWKFDPVSDCWIWVKGAELVNQPGVYSAAVPADNVPGARYGSVSWIDASGNLWLFGGNGYDKVGAVAGRLNDLWKFNPTSGNWTWVKGADTVNQQGVYEDANPANNIPGARDGSVSWIDASGNLWLFGGWGRDINSEGWLNDLWKFNPTSGNWTWVKGADTRYQVGAYGTRGVADASNVPGARGYSISWIDTNGNLWLFGGNGYDKANQGRLNDLWKFNPATSQWTWVSGSDTIIQTGVYGTRGVADDLNVPGARFSPVSWIDANGNLRLFSGDGYDSASALGYLNDLWKFNPATSQWTWLSGATTRNQSGVYGTIGKANVPGARYLTVSWTDASGNLWLFGGDGYDSAGALGALNDLWKFDGAGWTWVSGANTVDQTGVYEDATPANNVPGARDGAISWTDAGGDLWLFGGYGRDSTGAWGWLNDLWKFDGTNWTWVSGATTKNQTGVYGTKGFAAAANVPGARKDSVSWTDAGGNLWLFGGRGYDSVGGLFPGILNDLWKFNPATSQWTWVSGADIADQSGVYGTKNVANASNVPGARDGAASWTDASGNLWLFGGSGNDSVDAEGYLNDLWKFDGANWTWVSGANTVYQTGVFGTKGVAASSNVPGAREDSVSWIDTDGNLWLFGGWGVDGLSNTDRLNDLWKFDGTDWTWVSGADIANQPGVYGTKGVVASSNVPGARYSSVSWTDTSGNLWLFGGDGYDKNAISSNLNDLWRFTIQ